MAKKSLAAVVLMLAMMALCATPAFSGVAVTYDGWWAESVGASGYPQARGFEFKPKVDMAVTQLGYYNNTSNYGMSSDVNVALYDNSGTLLATADVLPSDSRNGNWVYSTLSAPVVLTAGQTYVISGAWRSANRFFYSFPGAAFSRYHDGGISMERYCGF